MDRPDQSPPAAVAADIFEGTLYRTVRPLGGGGMGEVFLVTHRTMGRRFVAKVPRVELAQHRSIAERLRVEVESLGVLSKSPHIVTILGLGQLNDGRPFFVTEYLLGRTLAAELAQRRQLPVLEALDYTCQLLRALEDAHALGIVHRDIKPENLFLCSNPNGERLFLKVLDFGIARILPDAPPDAPDPLETRTSTGALVGTPRYMSPEGSVGRRVDARADIYAAALVLYLMLSGRGPFDHIASDDLVLAAHAVEEPAPPSEYAKEPVPPELDRALLRSLSKDPAARFQTAREFRAELEAAIELLQHPQGWLETSAFDPESLANAPRGPATGERPSVHVALAEQAADEDLRAPTAAVDTAPSSFVMVAILLGTACATALTVILLARLIWGIAL